MYEKRKAVRTGRAAARPARVALTHAAGVLLAIVAVLSLFSVNAYALPGSEKNAYPLGDILMSENVGSNRGTVVYGAANEFFATLCVIGRKSDYLQLSTDQLAELSNEGSGGAFWELSQRWSNYGSDGEPSDWPVGITLAMIGQGLVSDPAYIWYGDYSYYETDSLYNRALADYLTIYNGGHLGGGGGSSNIDSVSLTVNPSSSSTASGLVGQDNVKYTNCLRFVNSTGYSSFGSSVTTSFPDGYFSNVSEDVKSGYDLVLVWSCGAIRNTTPSSSLLINYYYFKKGHYTFTHDTINYNSVPYDVISGITTDSDYYYYNSSTGYTAGYFDSGVFTVTRSNMFNLSHSNSGTSINVKFATAVSDGSSGGSGGGPVTGPNNWPDPPSNPTVDPPEVPEPQEPTGPGIDPPNPIGYTIDPTDDPDPVTDPYVVVVAPDSQDIISWLRAILQAINNLGDKLNDESTELQRALNDVFFGNLSKLLKNIKGEFLQDFTQWLDLELEWMMESIESLILDLQDYLHDLFEWLADQMNFEFDISTDPYDDTSLLNWLRRIYNKLGADGGPNTRPVDPSTDPEGFLDWLRRMIAEFILGLGASASDFVSDLGDLLSRLFAKFPFSVPWDLLGILGLLDAAPVAPRANFTIPLTIGNHEFNWTVDINLSGWSTYMESVRTIILVSFISWLAWLTPNVLRDLDPGDFL